MAHNLLSDFNARRCVRGAVLFASTLLFRRPWLHFCWSQPVWPDVDIKRNPNFTISSLKNCHISFYLKEMFSKVAQKVIIYLGNSSEKFVTINFQISPNLVTLNYLPACCLLFRVLHFRGDKLRLTKIIAEDDDDGDSEIREAEFSQSVFNVTCWKFLNYFLKKLQFTFRQHRVLSGTGSCNDNSGYFLCQLYLIYCNDRIKEKIGTISGQLYFIDNYLPAYI